MTKTPPAKRWTGLGSITDRRSPSAAAFQAALALQAPDVGTVLHRAASRSGSIRRRRLISTVAPVGALCDSASAFQPERGRADAASAPLTAVRAGPESRKNSDPAQPAETPSRMAAG